ncbi:MAG TPA: VOC family protein, partial [Burkholderiales bacterium]|nr:VOC family protein [Burkholderiales bacterium]
MLRSHIDHLVVTAPSLATGVEYVQDILGVILQRGGEHARMSTHNALLRLGPALYLEVIAVNPRAMKPERPRWFELDHLAPHAEPRLATWVARTNDIRAAAMASSIPLGAVESMSRGALSWLITIPPDGSLPHNGIAPSLIEWHTAVHP